MTFKTKPRVNKIIFSSGVSYWRLLYWIKGESNPSSMIFDSWRNAIIVLNSMYINA